MSISTSFDKRSGITYVYEVTDNHWVPSLKRSVSHRKLIGKIDPVSGNIVPTGKRGRPPGKKNPDTVRTEQASNSNAGFQDKDYKSMFESAMRTISERDEEIRTLRQQMNIMNSFDVSALQQITNSIQEFQKENQKDL